MPCGAPAVAVAPTADGHAVRQQALGRRTVFVRERKDRWLGPPSEQTKQRQGPP